MVESPEEMPTAQTGPSTAKASALTGEEILAGCPEMLRGSGLVQVTGKEGRAQVVLELPP